MNIVKKKTHGSQNQSINHKVIYQPDASQLQGWSWIGWRASKYYYFIRMNDNFKLWILHLERQL